jgi:tartrate/fumarate subfamily iron-sulfur-dependent hydro-lyase beta chain
MKLLKPPLSERQVRELKAGDLVAISGRIITFRDRAYARVSSGRKPPLDLKGWVVYHCGPLTKREKGKLRILSAGPTTSARLDDMQADFVRRTGVRCLIGKGGIGREVARELRKLGCIYLAFTGGAGVLAAEAIEEVERVLWEDLGDLEALWVLRVKEFGPLVVAIDLHGGNLYLKAR